MHECLHMQKSIEKHNRHVYTNVELSGPRQIKVEISGPRQIHVDTNPCENDGPGHDTTENDRPGHVPPRKYKWDSHTGKKKITHIYTQT